jgi:hypothetical protein
MSTNASQAFAAVRARLEAAGSGITIALYFQGDDPPILPDLPTPFAYVAFNNEGSGFGPVSFGGGRGANVYRNRAHVEAYTFAPAGEGLAAVCDYAETIAAQLRSYRDDQISCFAADVVPVGDGSTITPPGLSSAVNNYQCAVAAIDLTFDQIG